MSEYDDIHEDPDARRQTWQIILGAAWALMFVAAVLVTMFFIFDVLFVLFRML